MKSIHCLLILLFSLVSSGLSEEVQHVIVFFDGTSKVSLIDSVNLERIYYRDNDTGQQHSTEMKNIYYIYSDYNKVFYFSPSIYDHLDYAEERGGSLTTVREDTLEYDQISFNRNLKDPLVLLFLSNGGFKTVPLLDVHSIRVDATAIEHSVKKGARISGASFLVVMLYQLKQSFSNYSKFTPKPLSKVNGEQFQSITFLIPLTIVGWMAYDIYFDKRTSYFRPLEREDRFPRDMFVFSVKRYIKNGLRNQWKAMLPDRPVPSILDY